MKKDNLLKVLGISFLVFIVLTWLIPAGSYDSTGAFVAGERNPIGLLDIFRLPIQSITTTGIIYGLFFIVVGGIYGVLNKIGVYQKVVSNIVAKYKGKEKTFLIITIATLTLFTSITGLYIAVVAFLPFFMAVLLKMGFDKYTVLTATVGSILVGVIGSTYGFNINGYSTFYLGINLGKNILIKIIVLIIMLTILLMFALKKANITKNSKEDIPLYEEKNINNKRSTLPFIILSAFLILIAFVTMYNWYYAFETTFFDDIYTNITGYSIKGIYIFKYLIGETIPFGYWDLEEFMILMLIFSLILSWIYNLKMKDWLDGFVSGAKEMLKPAIYTMLVTVAILVFTNAANSTNVYYTIQNFLYGLSEKFNVFVVSLVSIISSVLSVDFANTSGQMLPVLGITYTDSNLFSLTTIILQSMYGLIMFIAPTSLLVVGGLAYLDVSYKDWVKHIFQLFWKLGLAIIAVIIAIYFFI